MKRIPTPAALYNPVQIHTIQITRSYRRTYPAARFRILVQWEERIADDVFAARSEEFHNPSEAFARFNQETVRAERECHPSIPSLGMV
jgi:hypothetical protein